MKGNWDSCPWLIPAWSPWFGEDNWHRRGFHVHIRASTSTSHTWDVVFLCEKWQTQEKVIHACDYKHVELILAKERSEVQRGWERCFEIVVREG